MNLTERMIQVLRAFDVKGDYCESSTPNELAMACGFYTGHVPGKARCNHAGRVMGPAQRIIFSLIGLRERGLVEMVPRRDRRSGTAYKLTSKGLTVLADLDR